MTAPHVPLDPTTQARLERIAVATLANALLKRGFRNVFLLGLTALSPDQPRLVGPAWTLRMIPAREDLDSMELYARNDSLHRRAIEECPEGAVLVWAPGGDGRASCMGDMMALRLKMRGVAGAITDGGYRDAPGIVKTGLPAFQAQASGPATPIWLHPADVNVPVGVAGVAIYPGDIIVADHDGVIAIPRHLADEIAAETENVADYEAFVEHHLRRGRSIMGLFPATDESRKEYENWVAQGRPEQE